MELSNYSTAFTQIVQQTRAREAALPLMQQTSGSHFFLQPNPSSKVCLFFHGFTALPEQFVPIGEAFFRAGYNVLIPLLPGHGIAGNWNGDNPPPLPEDPQTYQQFGLYWLQQAQTLGKVVVGGLSGGSTLAAWLALEHPQQIYRSLLFAPYLRNSNKIVDLLVRILNIYFEWRTKPGNVSFGYDGFLMPALEVFLNMGQDVFERAETSVDIAPMFIISSESDRTVSQEDYQTLFATIVKHQPKSWYHRFDKFLDIPHNMMTLAEGNNYQNLLIAIAKAYVESDLTWAEVEEISYRILKEGKTCNAVVAELNLSQRVSPDLPVLMTVIDQQAIVSSRNQE